jgi:hypothetical protein
MYSSGVPKRWGIHMDTPYHIPWNINIYIIYIYIYILYIYYL